MILLRSLMRFGAAIPKYRPAQEIKHVDVTLPKRPRLDDKDPYEKYDIVNPQPYLFRQTQENQPSKRFFPGTQYLAVHKNGITYHLFDASRIPYGRMCVRIASYLSGKHKPTFRNSEAGKCTDKCIVVNATRMYFTGKKINQKYLTYHTGYIGHLRQVKYRDLVLQKPEQLVAWTVSKMLPKNSFRFDKLDNIHVFREREHTFTDVLPQILPHQVEYEYNGSLYDDIKKGDGTVTYTNMDPNSQEFKDEIGTNKVNLMDTQGPLEDDEYKPFSQRGTRIKKPISDKEYMKLVNRRKHVMKRYRKYYARPYAQIEKEVDYSKAYLVKTKLHLKRLKLQKLAPNDDEPEIDDEVMP